ncbi:MAG: VOC family protein [Chitinophagaceae bacterium]|nr:MAG: VOC family protein [Chitinophagaceae bacterium]
MVQPHFYFNFPGTAEAALRFYQSVLGGEFPVIMRMKDMPQMPGVEKLSADEMDKMMHMSLILPNGSMFMATDALESMGFKLQPGNSIQVSLGVSSKEEADQVYGGLSAGGSAISGMRIEMWGDYFGTFTDKFNVQWMVSFSENPGHGEVFDRLESAKKPA